MVAPVRRAWHGRHKSSARLGWHESSAVRPCMWVITNGVQATRVSFHWMLWTATWLVQLAGKGNKCMP